MHRRLEWLQDDSDSRALLSPSRWPTFPSSFCSWQSWLPSRVHLICLYRGTRCRSCHVPARVGFERNRRDSLLSWFSLHAMERARICLLKVRYSVENHSNSGKQKQKHEISIKIADDDWAPSEITLVRVDCHCEKRDDFTHFNDDGKLRRIHKWTH